MPSTSELQAVSSCRLHNDTTVLFNVQALVL